MAARTWLPLSGIVFVATVLGMAVFAGDTPPTTTSGAEVAAFYDEHEAKHVVTAFVFAASSLFLILFAVALAAAVPGSAVWERVQLAGSALTAAVVLVAAVVHFALADGGVSPAALEALNAIDGSFWVGFNAALGVMMVGAAGMLLPHVGWFRRLGWVALVLGVALFIPVVDFVALVVTAVWIVVVSVALARGAVGAPATVAPQPA